MIEVRDVVHRYPGQSVPALAGVTLHVPQGSLFGLLGPNGSGKTTLISILTGVMRADSGSVRIDSLDLPAKTRDVQRFSSLVPQENAFYPTLSVAENLKFFASVQDIPSNAQSGRIEEALHITGLDSATGIRANRLSGGMKRRLSIALGLLNHPRLLFLDEPTVGIDPQSRQFLLDAIKRINAGGTTVVYCSHYMEEVEYLCNEVAILDSGRVLKQGSLDSLLEESRLVVAEAPVRAAGLQELFFKLTKRELRDSV